jgi:hypothetical protein
MSRSVNLGYETNTSLRALILHVLEVGPGPGLVKLGWRDDAGDWGAWSWPQSEARVEVTPALVLSVEEGRIPTVVGCVQMELIELEEGSVCAQVHYYTQ